MLWFKYVEYYHYLHHQHPNKNFNGCYPPVWDLLLGTSAKQTDLDRDVWRLIKEGKSVDRKGRSLTNPD
jgi:sterol desaturase/sphingolipid hydroxylase (fatty acid hydroxylase superfamily)